MNNDDFFRVKAGDGAINLKIENEAEACAAVLFACRRADEIDGPGGNEAFHETLKTRNIFIGSDPEALIKKAEHYLEQAGGPAALINFALDAIREQTRLPLFYHCLDVILADGVVTPSEHKAIQYLKGKFKVDNEVVFKALDVLLVKNQL